MTTLVAGATGATGRLLVQELIERGERVRVIVRSVARLGAELSGHDNVSVVQAGILELSDTELAEHVRGCGAVASCLGHDLSFRGLFGPPRRLVTDATRRLCTAIRANNPGGPVRFVLMNTTGNRNLDLDEHVSTGEKCVIGLLRLLLPPHADNEDAANYLRTRIGQLDDTIRWVAVRPDTLFDETAASGFEVHASPTRSAIFDAGRTSRINVARFMADLISDNGTWDAWQGQMPVIYNTEPESAR